MFLKKESFNEQVKEGSVAASTEIFDLGSATLGIVLENLIEKENAENNEQNQNDIVLNTRQIELLKENIIYTTSIIILTQNLDNDISYYTEYFTVQIFKNSIDAINDYYSIENKLPLVDVSACEAAIRDYYGWDFDTDIPISKINWNPELFSSDGFGDVSYLFYDPFNGENINSEQICKDIEVLVKIPTDPEKINITLYNEYKEKSIDILDSTNPFFTSRCIPFTNTTSNSDVTLADRRDLIYQNQSITCSIGCKYEGLDENQYAICNCYNTNETNAIIKNAFFSSLSESNIDIFICFRTAFNIVILFLFLFKFRIICSILDFFV